MNCIRSILHNGIHRCTMFFAALAMGLLFLASCEKEYPWETEVPAIHTLVVEGILTNENRFQTIRLSYPAAELNASPAPVTTAEVTLHFAGQALPFTHDASQPGVYVSQESFAAAVGVQYRLEILLDTLPFEAHTYMVPVLPAEPVGFSWHPDRMRYSLQWNQPQYSPIEQAMHEVVVRWDHLPGWNHPDSLSHARLLFYTLGTIDVSYNIIPPQMEMIYFPPGSIITHSKFSLTPEHASFLRALLSETQWQGSLFETARANLPGNISNGGLGYLGASAVIRKTLVAGAPGQ